MYNYQCHICAVIKSSNDPKTIPAEMRQITSVNKAMISVIYECQVHNPDVLAYCIDNVKCQCGSSWDCAIYSNTIYKDKAG